MKREQILGRIRDICLALPEADETVTFGNPTFRAGRRTFAVVEEYRGHYTLAVKVGKLDQSSFLQDERFFETPYVGKHGWVSLILDQGRLDWNQIRSLIEGSFRLVAPKRALRRKQIPLADHQR